MSSLRGTRFPASGTLVLGVSIVLALSTLVLAKWTLEDRRSAAHSIFAGDPLWPAQLYDDVVVQGYPYSSFKLPGANSFFPDVGLYFLFRSATGSVRDAMPLLWLSMIGLMTLGSACAVTACAAPKQRKLAFGLSLSVMSLMIAFCCFRFFRGNVSFYQSLLPVHHGGAVSCAFFGVALVVAYFESASSTLRAGILIALTLLCTAIVASDRLFIVWFTGPVGLTLLLARFRRLRLSASEGSDPFRRSFFVLAAIALGSMGGVLVAKWIHAAAAGGDSLGHFYNGTRFSRLLSGTVLLWQSLGTHCLEGDVLEISMVLWLIVALAVCLRAWWRPPLSHSGADDQRLEPSHLPSIFDNPKFVFFCELTFVMFGANWVIFLTSSASFGVGQHPWPVYARYFLAPQLFSLFGWALLLTHGLAPRNWLPHRAIDRVQIAIVPALVLLLLVGAMVQGRHSKRPAFDDYPWFVKRLDDHCERLGLRYGLADYTVTRSTSLLSKRGVQVRPYTIDWSFPTRFRAFHGTTNAAWFWQPDRATKAPVKYDFIVAYGHPNPEYGLSPAAIKPILGEPAKSIPLGGGYTLMVYNRPEDKLHDVFTNEANYLNYLFQYGNVNRVTYRGGALVAQNKDPSFTRTRTAIAGQHEEGVFVRGPYLSAPADGHYKVVCRTSSRGVDAPNGKVVALLGMDGKPPVILGEKYIPVGENQEVELEFDLESVESLRQMEFLTVFGGRGELTLHEVELSRDPVKSGSQSLLSLTPSFGLRHR